MTGRISKFTIRFIVFSLAAVGLLFPHNLAAQQSGTGLLLDAASFGINNPYSQPDNPVPRVLPFTGKQLKQSNPKHALPLPFGTGASLFYYHQEFFTDSLFLTSISPITGDTIYARPDTMIQHTMAHEIRFVVKPNVWVFPFLNLYGLAGYASGIIKPNIVVPQIIVQFPGLGEVPIDTTVEIKDDILLNGPVYGFGATFAIGFGKYFLIADYNYSVTLPYDLDSKIVYNTFAPKMGVRIKPSNAILLEIWSGAMYFENAQVMSGKMKVSDFSSTLAEVLGDDADYWGTMVPIRKWNVLLGSVLTLHRRHRFTVEAGFVNRTQLQVGYEFRF